MTLWNHYIDVKMGTMASQITSITIVHSVVYSGVYQRYSPHKGPVTRKIFPHDDVIMTKLNNCMHVSRWMCCVMVKLNTGYCKRGNVRLWSIHRSMALLEEYYGTLNRTLMLIFWYQKMNFWYQKSEIHFWYQEIIFWYQKINFWAQKMC